jgi:DinB superfamily
VSVFTNPSSSTAADTARYVSALLELLGEQDPIAVFRRTPDVLTGVVAAVPERIVTIPEAPGKWSIRHVVQHLADSEMVGGVRLRLVLAQDRPPLTGYDQDLWAARLHYHEAVPEESLETFRVLRRGNVRLIERASPEDLHRVGVHAERGEESLAHHLRLYAGHDILHLRQIDRIRQAL